MTQKPDFPESGNNFRTIGMFDCDDYSRIAIQFARKGEYESAGVYLHFALIASARENSQAPIQ